MCVGTNRHTKSPRQAKVCKLDLSLGVDKQVLRFQVSVEDTVRVTKCQTLKKLEQVALQRQYNHTNRHRDNSQ